MRRSVFIGWMVSTPRGAKRVRDREGTICSSVYVAMREGLLMCHKNRAHGARYEQRATIARFSKRFPLLARGGHGFSSMSRGDLPELSYTAQLSASGLYTL